METYSSMSQAQSLVKMKPQALYNMKYEVASELAIQVPNGTSWGDVTSRDCGRIGGNITRKLVEMGKAQLQ